MKVTKRPAFNGMRDISQPSVSTLFGSIIGVLTDHVSEMVVHGPVTLQSIILRYHSGTKSGILGLSGHNRRDNEFLFPRL